MQYSCANARIDITPSEPCALAGYSHRTGVWCHVASRLEANAILLCDGKTRVLFIAADLLYFGADMASVLERHAQKYGIPSENLILSASHTHFAPVTERTKPALGGYDETYNKQLEAKLAQLIDLVISARATLVHLRASRASTDTNINRRRRWPLPTITRRGLRLGPSIVMAPAPSEPIDNFIDTLQFTTEDGSILCVAWKFACHPVGFPDTNDVSAEFPGYARNRLRQEFGDDVTVVFWQGFAGDVRPRLSGKKSWKDRVRDVRGGPSFGEIDKKEWLAWCVRISDALVAALRNDGASLSGNLRVASVAIPLSSLLESSQPDATAGHSMRIQKVALGEDYSILFFAAEVCSPYLQFLKAGANRICAGYTGEVFGYLPSESQAKEGGYEGGGYLDLFGLSASLRSGFEHEVLDAVRQLDAHVPHD